MRGPRPMFPAPLPTPNPHSRFLIADMAHPLQPSHGWGSSDFTARHASYHLQHEEAAAACSPANTLGFAARNSRPGYFTIEPLAPRRVGQQLPSGEMRGSVPSPGHAILSIRGAACHLAVRNTSFV